MPSSGALVTFATTSLILVMIPGPSVLFVVGRSMTLGRRNGLLSVLGTELGALPLVGAVAFGVGAIVADSVVLFTTIKLLGAGYLIYLGIQAIRRRRDGGSVDGDQSRGCRESGWVTLRQGFVVGATNPKTIVFFVAALPQFVNWHGGSVAAQMMVLGLVFVGIAVACDTLWALLAGAARQWFESSPERLSFIRAAGGGIMVGLGGVLAATGNKA